MEIRAYSDLYIESAQNIIGHMFDFAINENGMDADMFASVFSLSVYARELERGNPTFAAGKTGPEIMRLVIEESGLSMKIKPDVMYIDRSPEYWAGWSLAYFQWYTNQTYHHILKAVPFSKIVKMYPAYHEMDIMKFVEAMKEFLAAYYPHTALKRYRELLGFSQRELSEKSGVPIRQIQLFEQRERDINKTQAITLLMLSKALGCPMERLMD
ncbi:MAG: helix-turn-helix domain-containing protein [Lachnospiraceae bacterium]|nr:helix-turn-helix domain-containing protein [Lachnospiraceae bacterium]